MSKNHRLTQEQIDEFTKELNVLLNKYQLYIERASSDMIIHMTVADNKYGSDYFAGGINPNSEGYYISYPWPG